MPIATGLEQALLTFSAELFRRVFYSLLPKLARQCPLPESVRYASKYFERIYVADGSTSNFATRLTATV